MSSVSSVHQANAQMLAQIQQLTQVASAGALAQTDHAVKLAKLNAEQLVQATSNSSNKSVLDTLI